jgi:hypothetical protein
VHDEELREPGHEGAEQEEGPEFAGVETASEHCGCSHDEQEGNHRDHCRARIHVGDAHKRSPHRDVQSPEENAGDAGEENARHQVAAVARRGTSKPLGERAAERAAISTQRW